ncbi:MAG: GNAT family N-acetyltransferase [Bacteroidales bacterium]|nr:GNAT family N-acetyltransferase [Bacteroidales bacterium]
MANLNIIKLPKNKEIAAQLAIFIRENEYLLPDPYSDHVDVEQYAQKLNSLGEGWGVIKDGKLVAFCGGYINDFTTQKAYLQLLLVAEKWHKRGLATSLIKMFYSYAQNLGFQQIQLTVAKRNAKALSLYIKNGFIASYEEHPDKLIKQYMILKINKKVDILRVQNCLLEMGNIIARVFEKHNIPYMITFGTLLGAVRHGGFIPWDDDFDFFLFDDTYEYAIEILRKELPDNLFLEDEKSEPLYFHGWAHVKDLNSEVYYEQFPQDNTYSHHGLSVDLFRCKKMKMSELCQYRKIQVEEYLQRKVLHRLISNEEYVKKLEFLTTKIESEEKDTISSNTEILAMAVPERYMEYKDVFPLKKYQFDKYLFYGPKDFDKILKHFYGDYMSLPKEENRIPHYSKVIFK